MYKIIPSFPSKENEFSSASASAKEARYVLVDIGPGDFWVACGDKEAYDGAVKSSNKNNIQLRLKKHDKSANASKPIILSSAPRAILSDLRSLLVFRIFMDKFNDSPFSESLGLKITGIQGTQKPGEGVFSFVYRYRGNNRGFENFLKEHNSRRDKFSISLDLTISLGTGSSFFKEVFEKTHTSEGECFQVDGSTFAGKVRGVLGTTLISTAIGANRVRGEQPSIKFPGDFLVPKRDASVESTVRIY